MRDPAFLFKVVNHEFTLLAQLIKANYFVILPTDAAPQFL